MQIEKKYWLDMLDADSADFRVQQNAYINLKDFRFGPTAGKGFSEQLTSVGGTVEVSNANLPTGQNYCIGTATDFPNRRAIYFNWNANGNHGIYCYDYVQNAIFAVLLNSQLTGGLNFDKNHLIHSARVENGCVYWTDNLNAPRRININDGIGMNGASPPGSYTNPLSQSVISWIRRQPGVAPGVTKQQQNTPAVPVNQIANEAFLFAYRYVYKDFELSTLSGWSYAANFNSTDQGFNRNAVFIPPNEKIDQDVIQIDLVAQYLISGVSFIIKSWRKSVPADLAAINAHNAGTAPLVYLFYNDATGIALDAAYVNKIFDSVPILAQTIEMAKNRAFFGNYTIGYNTPIASSLAFTTSNFMYRGGGGIANGEWLLLKYRITGTGLLNSVYVLGIPVVPGSPLHEYYTWSGTAPPFPTSVNRTDLTLRGIDAQSTADSIQGGPGKALLPAFTDQGVASTVTGGGTSTATNLGRVFKTYSSYQLSISFKDNAGPECGIYTNSSLSLTIPDALTDQARSAYTFISAINWTLSNSNALNEIPVWAYYFSVNITKCLRTRFFIQSVGRVVYAAKDASNNYTFTTTAYDASLAGIAIDLSLLQSNSMGYVFALGDIARLAINSTFYNLSIIGQAAQYIICQLTNIGSLGGVIGNYEIYTPYKKQINEPYFEIGQIIPITNPGTNTRTYSQLAGVIGGDVTVLQRSTAASSYITEVMSPNDKFYTLWVTDAGRPNFIDYFGQSVKTSSIAYSNTFIPGSQNNGLSTFDALDTQDISPDFGPISKLQLASKVSKIGTVMLAICQGSATASIYLGENTLISQTGDAVVAQANTVIGSIHELKGGFGTLSPESVFEFRGNIYWFDVQNGMVIQYADNGLFPISNYKMSRFWKLFADTYKSLSAAQIEAFGSRPFVFGGVDPYNGELLWTVPNVSATPINGYLPDYPSIPYPFDIWDGLGKTLVYKLYTDPNHWQGSYSFSAETLLYIENNLFSFKNGKLYLHNQDNQCNYYGVQYDPVVMAIANQAPTKPKIYNNFSAESNQCPSFAYTMSRYPYIQSSDLVQSDFGEKEGIWYAPIYRNKLDPAFGNNYPYALINGEKMRSTALYAMTQWNATGGIVQVKFINLGYTLSIGQKV